MAVPQRKNPDETVEVPADLVAKYQEAEVNASAWAKIRDQYKSQVQALLGSATAATVDGEPVFTYRPSEKWAEAQIIKHYPDMVQHFMRVEQREVFDLEAFRIRHPQIADQYRVRTFRAVNA
jgi:hypothetical protein